MLTIWGRTDSSNVQALLWCVGELGLPCRRIDAGHRFGMVDTAEFRAMNPNGTVPVLQDGDGPFLWETGAILRYLANRYAAAPFWPGEPIARAEVDRWAEWSKINIALGFTAPVFWHVVRTPAHRRLCLAQVSQPAGAVRSHPPLSRRPRPARPVSGAAAG